MRILLLGGTGFVGRHVVLACLERGHQVTLFCRGLSDPQAFPGIEHLRGDRALSAHLAGLEDRRFDVVIDTSGYLPREVRASARAVARGVTHYVFLSTISVYADFSRPLDESSRVAEPESADDAVLSAENYGALKVACERAVQEELGARALVVRPGRILGPHDSDERVPWMLRRIAAGGEVLAPGDPSAPVQFIDARDLGAWMVSSAERRLPGVFNAVGPPLEAAQLYETMRAVTGSDARFTWAPEELLLTHGVGPFTEAPFWLPRAFHNGLRASAARAVAEGLAFRTMVETVRDEWAWLGVGWSASASVRAQRKLDIPVGMSAEREAALLAAVREGAVR